MSDFTVEELPIPGSIEGAAGRDFRDSIDVRNAVEIAGYGIAELAVPAEEIFLHWRDPHEPKRWWVARTGGRVIGRGLLEWQLEDDSRASWVRVEVHPDHAADGEIAAALMHEVETAAREQGFSRMLSWAISPDGPGERLVPPTGAGSIPVGNPEVRFLTERGWRLEQITRASRFPLPADVADLERRRDEAAAIASDYRVHNWQGAVPADWLDDMAVMYTRMSTDAPSAGLEEPEDVWTPERIVEEDSRYADGPSVIFRAVTEHIASGRLTGYTQLSAPRDLTGPVSQDDTLVLREHRGHRLGMLLKVANLLALSEQMPGHPSVLTWNAEENRPMLDVNEAVGFVPIGYEGAWRKDL